jgi:GABA permease
MPWTTKLLVVASQTADSDELLEHLRTRAEKGPIQVTLVVPADHGGREAARERLARALDKMRGAGLQADGVVGDADPLHAVLDVYSPRDHDEILVSTFAAQFSRWVGGNVPHRVAQSTGALVHHVEVHERRPEPESRPAAQPERRGILAALSALGWGRRAA